MRNTEDAEKRGRKVQLVIIGRIVSMGFTVWQNGLKWWTYALISQKM